MEVDESWTNLPTLLALTQYDNTCYILKSIYIFLMNIFNFLNSTHRQDGMQQKRIAWKCSDHRLDFFPSSLNMKELSWIKCSKNTVLVRRQASCLLFNKMKFPEFKMSLNQKATVHQGLISGRVECIFRVQMNGDGLQLLKL
jgi:hypothetical protein